jgi:hypothetical protein
MTSAEAAFRLAFSAEHIWPFIDWLGAEKLVGEGALKRVTFEPRESRVGAVRVFEYTDSPRVIPERLESINERDRYYTYRMLDTADLPFTDYVGEVRLTPAGSGGCCVRFGCTFTPVDASAEDCVRLYVEAEKKLCESLRRAAARARRSLQ